MLLPLVNRSMGGGISPTPQLVYSNYSTNSGNPRSSNIVCNSATTTISETGKYVVSAWACSAVGDHTAYNRGGTLELYVNNTSVKSASADKTGTTDVSFNRSMTSDIIELHSGDTVYAKGSFGQNDDGPLYVSTGISIIFMGY